MKNVKKSSKSEKNIEVLISKLSENEVLNIEKLSAVKGGLAEGDGSVPIVITKL
jgi:hypothetical protein